MLNENFIPVISKKKSSFEVVKLPKKHVSKHREEGYVATIDITGTFRLNVNASEIFKKTDNYFMFFADRKAQKIMIQATTKDNPDAIKVVRSSAGSERAKTFTHQTFDSALPDYPKLDTKNFMYKFLAERDYEQEVPTLIIDFSEPLKITPRKKRKSDGTKTKHDNV